MLIFAISIMPKSYFHNWIAKHKDGSDCIQVHKTPALHHQSFNCHFEDLVVTTSYVMGSEQQFPLAHYFFPIHQAVFRTTSRQMVLLQIDSRGPPTYGLI
jgi:hypothetical protein